MNNAITTAAESLFADARKISLDDLNILTADFDAFCRVMWPDDEDAKARGLTRDDYHHALQIAWAKLQASRARRATTMMNTGQFLIVTIVTLMLTGAAAFVDRLNTTQQAQLREISAARQAPHK
jgi:hypothetical protein